MLIYLLANLSNNETWQQTYEINMSEGYSEFRLIQQLLELNFFLIWGLTGYHIVSGYTPPVSTVEFPKYPIHVLKLCRVKAQPYNHKYHHYPFQSIPFDLT